MNKACRVNDRMITFKPVMNRWRFHRHWLSLFSIVAVLLAAGCKKADNAPPQAGSGQGFDMAKLREAFPSPTPDVNDSLAKLSRDMRYASYDLALQDLAGLASNPALTDPQKQAVSSATDQVKQMQAAAPPKPAQ
jgi:hypothetical protein